MKFYRFAVISGDNGDARSSGRKGRLVFDMLSAIVLTVVLVLVCITFQDYGISWDEEIQNTYGKKILSYYLSGLEDQSVFKHFNLYLYGGSFDLIAAIVNTVSPFGEYETRHLLGGLTGALGLAGVWRLGRLFGGPRVGFLALMLMTVTPVYYGHMFINPKDIPFACGMVWSLYLMCRMMESLPRVPLKSALLLGAVLGLTLGTRIIGVLAGFYLALALVLYLVLESRSGAGRREVTYKAARIVLSLLPMLPVLYLTMASVWPWSWQEPLNPVRAATVFANFPWPGSVLVNGTMIKATELPAYYLPLFMVAQLPELVLAGLMAAFLVGGLGLTKVLTTGKGIGELLKEAARPVVLRFFLLILSALFPLIYFMVARPLALNGMRHFLFMLLPCTVLAALALDRLWTWGAERWPARQWAIAMPLAVTIIFQTWSMVRLHPEEYIFYNQLVGGVAGADGRFELDYWGTSIAEATEIMEAKLKAENGGRLGGRYKVFVCANPTSALYFLPPNFVLTEDRREADFFVALTLSGCDKTSDGKIIAEVSRFGAKLAVVKDRRDFVGRPVARVAKPLN
ncbi:hypothetical protein GGE65_003753 [Skermanella aerolata]|uniref:glycosyltransferase family 39 protein n=1 Tax=Skermanella aerolata TaxID=393310 RepID=UPI003D19181C